MKRSLDISGRAEPPGATFITPIHKDKCSYFVPILVGVNVEREGFERHAENRPPRDRPP